MCKCTLHYARHTGPVRIHAPPMDTMSVVASDEPATHSDCRVAVFSCASLVLPGMVLVSTLDGGSVNNSGSFSHESAVSGGPCTQQQQRQSLSITLITHIGIVVKHIQCSNKPHRCIWVRVIEMHAVVCGPHRHHIRADSKCDARQHRIHTAG